MSTQLNLNPKIEKKPGCVAEATSVLGNKWTALIVMELSQGCARFSHLEKSVEGINPRILSQRLDYLEQKGIVIKNNFAEVPPRIEYTLTEKGRDLLPILKSMAAWGYKYAK
jgi:DNA-binding HxlR family transcriptional regulator